MKIKQTLSSEPLPFLEQAKDGVYIRLRVLPRSSKNMLCGVQTNALKVKIIAPPVEGEANRAVIDFISGLLSTKKGAVTMDSGLRSRNKRLFIEGMTASEARRRLQEAMKA